MALHCGTPSLSAPMSKSDTNAVTKVRGREASYSTVDDVGVEKELKHASKAVCVQMFRQGSGNGTERGMDAEENSEVTLILRGQMR